jgi:lipoprotein-anchoring transpeptidase ErfK/SrfK
MEAIKKIKKNNLLIATLGLGVALFAAPILVEANTFVFSPKTLKWKAINNKGKVIRSGRGSGGRSYCKDIKRSCRTPSGTYHIISKRGADCRSSRYPVGRGGARMPHCMFFSKHYAIHGSSDVPNYNASHGCVRVKPKDARWLHKNFMHIGTKVIIKSY